MLCLGCGISLQRFGRGREPAMQCSRLPVDGNDLKRRLVHWRAERRARQRGERAGAMQLREALKSSIDIDSLNKSRSPCSLVVQLESLKFHGVDFRAV